MNKPLILVVEDDAAVRNLIATTLDTHDYRYHTAPSGEAAILEAASHNPDVVLLDLGLDEPDCRPRLEEAIHTLYGPQAHVSFDGADMRLTWR